jgi:phosphoribosylanthranilate isomerase
MEEFSLKRGQQEPETTSECTMKVQIYTAQTPEEARALLELGVDHIGITPANLNLPGEVDLETARAIVEATGGGTSVVLSVSSDLDEIEEMVAAVQPDILHLCGLEGELPPKEVGYLRNRLAVPIMQAISVTGSEAIAEALAYQDVSDYLILDTQDPDIAGIGASGTTHDWSISREIVRRVSIPVILAGGLSPENVAEAAAHVGPWGVDSLTHTNFPLPSGGFRKDLDLVAAFVQAARKVSVD